MRMRRKKNLIPRMEACADWLIREPQTLRGHWRSLLPGAQALRVELGCGKGRFTCETAAAEPEVLFVAVERVPDAMVMAMERARDLGCGLCFSWTPTRRASPTFSPRGKWTGSISTSVIPGPPSATPSGG